MNIEQYAVKHWYQKKSKFSAMLLPLALVYSWIIRVRHFYLKRYGAWNAPVPVVVVGNITVGGVGKTPLVVAIAQYYLQQGWRVGVVCRGYGAKVKQYPHEISVSEPAALVGDEPLFLAMATGCPVVIAPKRVQAVQALLQKYPLDLIISDDGLQHYALGRKVEIALLDAQRGLGNERLLPAGPLREPKERLNEVDLVVVNGSCNVTAPSHMTSRGVGQGSEQLPFNKNVENPKIKYSMHLQPFVFKALKTGKHFPLTRFKDKPVSAVAGIGHPEQFFNLLEHLGLFVNRHVFSDHHAFKAKDFESITGCVVMTDKDAVKCRPFAQEDWYSLSVEAQLEAGFWVALTQLLGQKK